MNILVSLKVIYLSISFYTHIQSHFNECNIYLIFRENVKDAPCNNVNNFDAFELLINIEDQATSWVWCKVYVET